jgi:hypothetical protein
MAGSSRRARILGPSALDALEKLRRICDVIGTFEERTSFGNPSFYAGGKSFAVIDHYDGADCLWLRIDPARRSQVMRDPGWFASPYDPHQKALCCRLDQIDWRRIRPLIRDSFDMVRQRIGESYGTEIAKRRKR